MIIDANRLGDFLTEPPKPDIEPIRVWLRRGGTLIYSTGGKFASEVGRRARARLQEYDRAGRAIQIPHSELADDVDKLRDQIVSDDPHVIALARFSGARVLHTHDKKLMEDFGTKDLIDGPRGTVYSSVRNADLLTDSLCRRPARRLGSSARQTPRPRRRPRQRRR